MLVDRLVLAVVHNVTAATRLLDVLDLVASDTRVQVEFVITGSSAFTGGTERFLLDNGIVARPLADIDGRGYDLAIAASHGGDLTHVNAPLVILPHGTG
ncbi:MAG: hypothetical protein M3548_11555 [Actinomycetota bacterium]|nr:hypothetical protein [Actinomycetota bacterium]